MNPRQLKQFQSAWEAYEAEWNKYDKIMLNLFLKEHPVFGLPDPEYVNKSWDIEIDECKIKMKRFLEIINEIFDISSQDERVPSQQERHEVPSNKVLFNQSQIFDELT